MNSRDAASAPEPSALLPLLLVEDDRLSAAQAQRLMERAGRSVRLAEDGAEALRLLAAERFAAAFLDVELPDTDGLRLARAFRAAPPGATPSDIPLFALTGHDPQTLADAADAAGLVRVLGKPLSAEDLAEALALLPDQTAPRLPFFDEADAEMARAFAAIFREETPRRLAELHDAARRRDAATMARLAHSLKSTTAMVSAPSATEAALRLERAAGAGRLDDCPELLAELENQLNIVQERLTALTD